MHLPCPVLVWNPGALMSSPVMTGALMSSPVMIGALMSSPVMIGASMQNPATTVLLVQWEQMRWT